MVAYFDRLTVHLRHVANIKWLHSVADDFFTKQLPFNVTWVLTLMYALDQGEFADDPVAQVNALPALVLLHASGTNNFACSCTGHFVMHIHLILRFMSVTSWALWEHVWSCLMQNYESYQCTSNLQTPTVNTAALLWQSHSEHQPKPCCQLTMCECCHCQTLPYSLSVSCPFSCPSPFLAFSTKSCLALTWMLI